MINAAAINHHQYQNENVNMYDHSPNKKFIKDQCSDNAVEYEIEKLHNEDIDNNSKHEDTTHKIDEDSNIDTKNDDANDDSVDSNQNSDHYSDNYSDQIKDNCSGSSSNNDDEQSEVDYNEDEVRYI